MIIEINMQSALPIYEQLRDQIVLGIAAKRLIPGEALPSVRNLAADLGVNFHTVNKAYATLCDEGFIAMDRRKGAVIAQRAAGSEQFRVSLTARLVLSAAEAACRELNAAEFLALCKDCYQNAVGVEKDGGSL